MAVNFLKLTFDANTIFRIRIILCLPLHDHCWFVEKIKLWKNFRSLHAFMELWLYSEAFTGQYNIVGSASAICTWPTNAQLTSTLQKAPLSLSLATTEQSVSAITTTRIDVTTHGANTFTSALLWDTAKPTHILVLATLKTRRMGPSESTLLLSKLDFGNLLVVPTSVASNKDHPGVSPVCSQQTIPLHVSMSHLSFIHSLLHIIKWITTYNVHVHVHVYTVYNHINIIWQWGHQQKVPMNLACNP